MDTRRTAFAVGMLRRLAIALALLLFATSVYVVTLGARAEQGCLDRIGDPSGTTYTREGWSWKEFGVVCVRDLPREPPERFIIH